MTLTLPAPSLGNGVAAEWGWGALLSHVRMEYAHAAFPLSPKKAILAENLQQRRRERERGPLPSFFVFSLSTLGPPPPPAGLRSPPLAKRGPNCKLGLECGEGPIPLSLSPVLNSSTRSPDMKAIWPTPFGKKTLKLFCRMIGDSRAMLVRLSLNEVEEGDFASSRTKAGGGRFPLPLLLA